MIRAPRNHRTGRYVAIAGAALALALLVACAGPAQSGPLRDRFLSRDGTPAVVLAAGVPITAPGRYELRLRHGGRDRLALVHVPAAWRANQPAPLVLALHGGGGGASYQADDARYGLITKSGQAGFVAVFPNGVTSASNGLLATWNAGTCCARARDEQVDDVGFLRAVVADVQGRLAIAPGQVFAIGMSNGGMMAYRLACEAADVFDGIMAVAGTDGTTTCAPARPVPVLHVHARNDNRVLFEGGAGRKFRRTELVTDFAPVPATVDKWVRLNRAVVPPRRVLAAPGAWCDRYEAGPGGAPVQLCVTESGGHSWPGGTKDRGGEAPSQAIRANDVMWDFFAGLR